MLVYFAVVLVGLLGFSGLALDVGRLELRKIQLQLAADAGALSAAAELRYGNSQWKLAATTEVTANANLNGYTVPSIAVQQGVTSGIYVGDNSTVQVTLTQTVPTTLLKLLGSNSSSLKVTAVAMIPPCLLFLGNNVTAGLTDSTFASAGLNNTSGCPVYAKNGYTVDGFAHICCTTPKTSGPASASGGGGSTSPTIQFNSPTFTDPLAYVASPSFSSCTFGLSNKNYTVNTTLSPGTYCGTLKVTGPVGGVTITMQPGLYVVTGGVSLTNATINGTGVTLYLTRGGGSGFGTFFANGSSLHLNAPTDGSSGGVPGVTIFADRAWSGGNQDIQFNQSTVSEDGLIYSTGTGVYSWATNMSGPHYFSIVTTNLYFFGAGLNVSANYSPLATGDPLRLAIKLVQ